ncbi:hypothetical protein OBBRIDRAFT_741110, partial [Obba rivulosa]
PMPSGTSMASGHPLTNGPVPTTVPPHSPQTPVSFTPEQINALRAQIHAFKILSRGMSVLERLLAAMRAPNNAPAASSVPPETIKAEDAEMLATSLIADAADLPKEPFLEDDLDRANLAMFRSRLQRLLVTPIMPTDLDLHQALAERSRFVDARIEQRRRSGRKCRR